MTLLACRLIRVSNGSVPVVVLAALSIIVHAALVLVVASIFASLTAAGALVRGALGRVGVGVKLEAVTPAVIGLDVVAGQAWNRDTADG
jgi:hypothetical protein